MKTIAFIASKGGAGKSTNTINMAVEAERAGHLVVVIDLDPQTSVANWADRRESDHLVVIPTHATRLDSALNQARTNGANFAFIDTQGRSSSDATAAARVADLVIMPQKPSSLDLEPEILQGNIDTVRLAGKEPYLLVNALNPTAHKQFSQLQENVTKRYGIPVVPFFMPNRSIHTEIATQGKGAQELAPDSKASLDIARLWLWIDSML